MVGRQKHVRHHLAVLHVFCKPRLLSSLPYLRTARTLVGGEKEVLRAVLERAFIGGEKGERIEVDGLPTAVFVVCIVH